MRYTTKEEAEAAHMLTMKRLKMRQRQAARRQKLKDAGIVEVTVQVPFSSRVRIQELAAAMRGDSDG